MDNLCLNVADTVNFDPSLVSKGSQCPLSTTEKTRDDTEDGELRRASDIILRI